MSSGDALCVGCCAGQARRAADGQVDTGWSDGCFAIETIAVLVDSITEGVAGKGVDCRVVVVAVGCLGVAVPVGVPLRTVRHPGSVGEGAAVVVA